MRARRGALPFLVAILLTAASCTNGSSNGASSGTDPAAASAGSTKGVTGSTIKLGWAGLDQSSLVKAGLATNVGDPTTLAQKIVASWNAQGGIHGRKVQLVARTFGKDIANLLPDMQAVCLHLTEDDQVFATVAYSWFGDAVTCMAGDHDTPLVTMSGLSHTVLATGHDNVFPVNFMWEDAVASSVHALDKAGKLDGLKKIGVFAALEPGMRETIDNGLAPALKSVGRKIDVDGTIPNSTAPDSAAIAAVVSRFKAEGVDAVFAMSSFYVNGAFMTEAEKQGYHPTYVMSDLSEGTDDLILKFAPAAQLQHAIGASWKGHLPDPVPTAADKQCLETYAPELKATDVSAQIGTTQVCEMMSLTKQGLEGAGTSLTRGSFISAMNKISHVTTSGGGQGGFGADTQSYPKQVRLVHFDLAGCKCWTAEGPWIDAQG